MSNHEPENHPDVWERDEADVCERCEGSGIVGYRYLNANRTELEYIKCSCQAASGAQRGGLMDYRQFTFDAFVPLPSVVGHAARCADYAAAPNGWLLLTGPYGTGKSHLSAAIANAVAERGASVYFATLPDLLDDLKATFDGDGETFTSRFERIRSVQLLVIDDLGTEKRTDWNAEKTFQLINHRYNRALPTVISTNVALERLDGRIRSRLSDVVLVERLDFSQAADYRSLGMAARRGVA